MRILCGISGIEFTAEHFPATLTSRETMHPIFTIPQKRLLPYINKYHAKQLTDTDSYLLFLALLNSTELVEWRVPAMRTLETNSLIANNLEALVKIVGKMNIIQTPSVQFARFAITPDTKGLENIKHWLGVWQQCIQDFYDGNKRHAEINAMHNRELALERMIKNPMRKPESYAGMLAAWAEEAGSFPKFITTLPNGTTIPCSEYWKGIIVACHNQERIFAIPVLDLKELIEHCEENIEHGTIYAHSLMHTLRTGFAKQQSYLGLGDIDISGGYRILDSDSSVQDANLAAMIDNAPQHEPALSEYPNRIAFLRAKMRWQLAQESRTPQEYKGAEL